MPALAPIVNIYFDTTQYTNPSKQLLSSLTSTSILNALSMVAADELILNLWPRASTGVIGAATVTQQLQNPAGLMVTGKNANNLDGPLFWEQTGFTELQDGNGNYYYQADLLLNTSQLLAAIAAADSDALACIFEIENVGTSYGWQRFQFDCTIDAAVYTSGESLPTSAQPQFWNQAQSDARYLRGDSGLTGKQVLSAGVSNCVVTGLTLPFDPDTVLAWVNQEGGSMAPIFGEVDEDSITEEGFTVYFSGLPPDAVHVLRWLCLPAPGAYSNGNPAVPPTAQNVVVTTAAASAALQIPGLVQFDLTAATGTVALTLTDPVTGADYVFKVIQGATPRNMTFPAGTKQKGGGGATYVASGANLVNLIRVIFDGTNYLIDVEDNYA